MFFKPKRQPPNQDYQTLVLLVQEVTDALRNQQAITIEQTKLLTQFLDMFRVEGPGESRVMDDDAEIQVAAERLGVPVDDLRGRL